MLFFIGKISFLLVVYGFVYVVFRAMMLEAQRAGGQPQPARRSKRVVDRWELRSPEVGPQALHPPTDADRPKQPPTSEVSVSDVGVRSRVGQATSTHEHQTAAAALSQLPLGETDKAQDEAPEAQDEVSEPQDAEEQPEETSLTSLPEEAAWLVVLTSPEASLSVGSRIRIGRMARFGRSQDNDVVLTDRFVSSGHAVIAAEGDDCILRDVGSTNGTFHNGVRIRGDTGLTEGDRIGIGTTMFAFHRARG